MFLWYWSGNKPYFDVSLLPNTSSLQVYLPLEYDLILQLVMRCLISGLTPSFGYIKETGMSSNQPKFQQVVSLGF